MPNVNNLLENELVNEMRDSNVAYLKNRPGFFTPYNSISDFDETLAAPVVAPAGFAIATGLLGVASALAASVCVTSFLAAGFAAALGKNGARDEALTVGVVSGIIALAAPLLAALSALTIVLSFLATTAYLVTRSAATVGSAIAKGATALTECFHDHDDEENSDEDLAFEQMQTSSVM
ncbi:hypothetical protein TUM19329_11730 [Legionella antarctica]|uniref:Transmembrane protein n=1 Tax=Legionella antarctica TaxID=2708020 RepID=A0A6F8T463_9GAMM|nr:hypothetical protein [Legionella antarctica]BCA94812.1 hypothetical protein TUM19329_11730 [Legionella antarctica]